MKKILEGLLILFLLATLGFICRSKLVAFYHNQGEKYSGLARYKEAIEYYDKAIKIDPSLAAIHYSLANAYLDAKMEDKAEAEYRLAIQKDRTFLPGYKALGSIYLQREAYQQAMVVLADAERMIPGNQEIKDLLARVNFGYLTTLLKSGVETFSAGDKVKAYELLHKALELSPDYPFTSYLLGYLYYSEKRYKESEEMLRQVVRLDDKFFLAYKMLGDIYFEKRYFDKAVEEYETAVAIDKTDYVVFSSMGLAYMNLEKYDQAIQSMRRALALSPGNFNLRYSLASLYRDNGQLDQALSEYRNLLQAQPEYPNAHNDLADIYNRQGRAEEALQEYRKEIDLCERKLAVYPDDPVLLVRLAAACNGVGEYSRAKEYVDKAIAIKADHPQAYVVLASIEKNQGHLTDSLTALDAARKFSSQKYSFIDKAALDTRELKYLGGEIFNPVDTVYLKNGSKFKGIIKEETAEGVVLEIDAGSARGTVSFPQNDIERIDSHKKR